MVQHALSMKFWLSGEKDSLPAIRTMQNTRFAALCKSIGYDPKKK